MNPNEKIISAVENYANEIIKSIKEYNATMEVDLDFTEATNVEETESARSALITTPIGVVVVIPDFKKNGASACILNLGEMNRMHAEGFDEAFIEKEGRIYGKPMTCNKNNIEVLGYYLTHKLDVQKAHKMLG